MKDQSRRSFFRYMTVLGLAAFSSTPLYAKAPKDNVKYQETPKDGKKCSDCFQFIPESNECKLVQGSINPDGWCMLWVPQPK